MSFQQDSALSSLYFISLQDSIVPVVAHAVFRTPDDGRKEHPKHVEKNPTVK
jgi:hypothetical protein